MPAEILTSDRFPKDGASLVFARMLNRHSPAEIAAAVEILIDVLDIIDGDPDAETCATEDDFTPMPAEVDFGPGCPIADAGEEDDPQGACDEDEVSTALANRNWGAGPGCPIADGEVTL